jgi:DNA-binding NtrC family response regulator
MILIVDDDARIRDAAAGALSAEGHDVIAAADGAEALEICRTQPNIELVITDVVMPRLRARNSSHARPSSGPICASSISAAASATPRLMRWGIIRLLPSRLPHERSWLSPRRHWAHNQERPFDKLRASG